MLNRSTTWAVMFAGAVALAAPAHAAVVEWHAGPVGLSAGKMVQVAISNPDLFQCTIAIQILASPKARVGTSLTNAALSTQVNTSRALPASSVQAVGVQDPNEKPGERRLVAAKVSANCPNASVTLVRELGVTLQVVDVATGETTLMVQAPAE